MITDVFIHRYPKCTLNNPHSFFVQLFNLYDDHHIGIHSVLLDKVQDHEYSSYIDEHIRIISLAQKRFCNELGYNSLDKPKQYLQPDWASKDYRIFRNYIFDENISSIEKLSLLEVIFRDTEQHLLKEIDFLKTHIPEYKIRSQKIKDLSKVNNLNYYNEGEEKLKKSEPQLENKTQALDTLRDTINKRLKQHEIPLSYHNGYFQNATNPLIDEHIEDPFWKLVSDPKYKNVETDMLEALNTYDSNGRDPALYAAKALESMLKIICGEKGFTKGKANGAGAYVCHLNSKDNGSLIINDEKEELIAMFKIRNALGHGPGNEPMPTLNDQQALRYIHSAMIWIYNLSKR